MDRLDAMAAFVATVEHGSLARAARALGRSPASITRAVAFVEQRTRAELLRRTTRSLKLTAAGERYLAACRRILAEVAEAERTLGDDAGSARGTLVVTAPAVFGTRYVRALADRVLDAHPELQLRLLLLDRIVNLVEEGVDVAIRIAHMPDSALVAVKVGEVRRVCCASPAYLARRGTPRRPAELAAHACIAFGQATPSEQWTFADREHVRVRPRLTVTHAEAAIASAVEGRGVTCVLSYQVDAELRSGALRRLLQDHEPRPLPIHVVYTAAGAASAKLRAFVERAVPELRAVLA